MAELDETAVAGVEEGRRQGLRDGGRNGLADAAFGLDAVPVEHVGQPVVHAAGRGVDGGVGRVDGDVGLGELQQDALLGVGEGDGLEAAEDEGVVGDDDRGALADGFLGDGDGEVVG